MRRKPKPYIEAQLHQMMPKLTTLCALDRIPHLTFSKQEVKKLGLRRFSNLGNRYTGFSWHKENVIYISPRHTAIEAARDTLYHEFTHLRFPYLAHGRGFEEKKTRLMKGEQFKPLRKG